MSAGNILLASFVKKVMSRRRRSPTQMAAELGVSHAAMSRWLSGHNVPNTSSCLRLAKYSGVPAEEVLYIAGHLPKTAQMGTSEWPEFREYAYKKYPPELDEDLITIIEHIIEQQRAKNHESGDP